MRRAALLAAVLGGCFHPQPPEDVACTSLGTCPSGLSCISGVCVLPGTQPIDAPIAIADAPDGPPGIDAHPMASFTPSNGVDPHLLDPLNTAITIDGRAVFDTDTGEITGAIMRPAGAGVQTEIAFTALSGLGVFAFAQLVIGPSGSVVFTGTRSVAFLVGTSATIAGAIDGSGGGCPNDPACAGPGGGRGALATDQAGGCGPGRGGTTTASDNSDAGGGGGGAGGAGGVGGAAGTTLPGGGAGVACLASTLEPLAGGSGGGGGGAGNMKPSHGGGGGGALQITALDSVTVAGTIAMGGGGGENGFLDLVNGNGSAGSGGGAGGAILLESPKVTLQAGSTLAANGGGGGGAGYSTTNDGKPGASGSANATPAPGGAFGASGAGAGGNGAAGTTPPDSGGAGNSGSNGGGGGGAIGRIFLRSAMSPQLGGIQSPPAGTAALKP